MKKITVIDNLIHIDGVLLTPMDLLNALAKRFPEFVVEEKKTTIAILTMTGELIMNVYSELYINGDSVETFCRDIKFLFTLIEQNAALLNEKNEVLKYF